MVYSGSSKFLDRIKPIINHELNKLNASIIRPNLQGIQKLKKKNKRLFIARIDGLSHVKFSYENLQSFLLLKYSKKIPSFKLINNINFNLVNKYLNNYLNRYNSYLINNADKIIFQSKLSFQMHKIFLNFSGDNYRIINNGAPINFSKNLKKNYKENSINLAITANFRPHKRLIDAINITNNLSKKYKNICLHIIGPIDPITKKELKKINTENLKFYGQIKQDKINEIYHSCHVGLSPSFLDPCPNSVVEMLSCGLPVVTTEASGAFELLDFNNKFSIKEKYKIDYYELQSYKKIPKINEQLWCEKIEFLLDNMKEYEHMTKEIFLKKLDIKIISSQYIDYIKNEQTSS